MTEWWRSEADQDFEVKSFRFGAQSKVAARLEVVESGPAAGFLFQ